MDRVVLRESGSGAVMRGLAAAVGFLNREARTRHGEHWFKSLQLSVQLKLKAHSDFEFWQRWIKLNFKDQSDLECFWTGFRQTGPVLLLLLLFPDGTTRAAVSGSRGLCFDGLSAPGWRTRPVHSDSTAPAGPHGNGHLFTAHPFSLQGRNVTETDSWVISCLYTMSVSTNINAKFGIGLFFLFWYMCVLKKNWTCQVTIRPSAKWESSTSHNG